MTTVDSFKSRATLDAGGRSFDYFRLGAVAEARVGDVATLPYSIRILLENLLRNEDGRTVTREHIAAVAGWDPTATPRDEIAFRPARVLLQDFTGVPAVVDLAAMREAVKHMGGDPSRINPLEPVDLVIDHSLQVDAAGTPTAFDENVGLEFQRNQERYRFLKWGQQAFQNLRVVPPGTGIVHQVNVEYLARVVFEKTTGGRTVAYPDSLVGTDSHTTMVNGLGVLGWGVGGIEAEAAMLGQPIAMLLPQVVGMKLTGRLREGTTATDLVLTVTQLLRKKGVVEKFVEFFGDGLDELSLPDKATLANMAPEYGATMGFFPVDASTVEYLRFSGRDPAHVALVEAYAKAQGLFRAKGSAAPRFSDMVELDLGNVVPSVAGPKRPQDRVALTDVKASFEKTLEADLAGKGRRDAKAAVTTARGAFELTHGRAILAAITSCTNTSNPAVLVAAGLVAKKAAARGLAVKPWVKTSLAPGSQVVTEYLREAGLLAELETLRFHVVGYGCTTCIGNSGPVDPAIAKAVKDEGLVVAAVLSGNRNFEGRVSPQARANYLASPPLVVAYALAGRVDIDFEREPLGEGADGRPVFLREVWPSTREVDEVVRASVKTAQFKDRYARVFEGPAGWRAIEAPQGSTFSWEGSSTYIRKAPFFEGLTREKPAAPRDLEGARVLVKLGDSVTTDHISPAGSIAAESAAARYLTEHGVATKDFNQYGARRGNHEVMMRGTFANVRLRNELVPGVEGGVTRHLPSGESMSIFDASTRYQRERVPLVVLAGKEYGTGSSRDWAAKGVQLLGVRAVLAETFERIHRSNLVGMGILPLEFLPGESRLTHGLTGEEVYAVRGIAGGLSPRKRLTVEAGSKRITVVARLDTPQDVEYFAHGGILQYVLRGLL